MKNLKRVGKKHHRPALKNTSVKRQEFSTLTITPPLQAAINSLVDNPSLRSVFEFIGQFAIEITAVTYERLWREYDPKTLIAHKQIAFFAGLPELSAEDRKWLKSADGLAVGSGFVNVAAGLRKDFK